MSKKPEAKKPALRSRPAVKLGKRAKPVGVKINAAAPKDAHPMAHHLPVNETHSINALHVESGELHQVQLMRFRQQYRGEYVEVLCYPPGYVSHPDREPAATDRNIRAQALAQEQAAAPVVPVEPAAPVGEPKTAEEMAAYLLAHPDAGKGTLKKSKAGPKAGKKP